MTSTDSNIKKEENKYLNTLSSLANELFMRPYISSRGYMNLQG